MNKNRIYPAYFMSPALLLYLLLFVVPGIVGIYYSFTDWNAFSTDVNFIGLRNYVEIIRYDGRKSEFLKYITNTLHFTVGSTAAKILFGLGIALLLDRNLIHRNLYRSVVFSPAILSILITGLIFRSIMHPTTGLLNAVLRAIGLDFMAQKWLVDPDWAMRSIIMVDVWKGVGYVMTIFMAGLQTIPSMFYEAADIDGAGYFTKLWYITIPMLVPAIKVNALLSFVHGIRVFELVYVLTNGGPGRTTEVMNTAVYKEFSYGIYARASALSTIMFLFMAICGFFFLRMLDRREVEL